MIVKENEYSTSLYNTGEELCTCTNRFKLKKRMRESKLKFTLSNLQMKVTLTLLFCRLW